MKIITTLLILFLFLKCSDIDGLSKTKKRKERTDLVFLSLALNRTKGNCVRKDITNNIGYCDRRSSGLCNVSELILTSSERAFNLNESNNLVKAVPSCNFSFLSSGITSDTVTTQKEEDSFRTNNIYLSVETCEQTGLSSTLTLLTETEILYISSSKGRIGVTADKFNSTPDSVLAITVGGLSKAKEIKADALNCLNEGFTQAEKDLFIDLRTLKKTKSLTCSTASGSSNSCPF